MAIRHNQKDYPEDLYRQPNERFLHSVFWTYHCSLCDYDREQGRELGGEG